MAYVLVLVVLAAAIYVITGPLRATRRERALNADRIQVAELEAARDAKYGEIRDAEMDMRTGKLSDADYEAIDQALRSEAVDILHRLDQAREAERIPSGP